MLSPKRREEAGLGLVLLTVFLLKLPGLALPLDHDEGLAASLAQAWLKGWGWPYRDFVFDQAPLRAWLFGLPLALGLDTALSLRVLDLFWRMATAALLYQSALALGPRMSLGGEAHRTARRMALFAGLFYAVLTSSQFCLGLGARAEALLSLPLCLAWATLSLEGWASPRRRAHFLCGAAIGLAALAKPVTFPGLWIFPLLVGLSWRDRLHGIFWQHLGAMALWLFVTIVFSLAGAASDLLSSVVTRQEFLVLSLAGESYIRSGQVLIHLLRDAWPLLAGLGLGIYGLLHLNSRPARLALAWLLLAVLGAVASKRFTVQAFVALDAPLALVAAWGLAQGSGAWRASLRWASLVLILWLGFSQSVSLWRVGSSSERARKLWPASHSVEAASLANVIREKTAEDVRLLVWGHEASIYFLARRQPATRQLQSGAGLENESERATEELLAAARDPRPTVWVLAEPLDSRSPFQKTMIEILQKQYELRVDLAPPLMLALRKAR